MDDLFGKLKYCIAVFAVTVLMMVLQFSTASGSTLSQQYVVMLSMDGFICSKFLLNRSDGIRMLNIFLSDKICRHAHFSWDYTSGAETPFLDFMAEYDVVAESVIPAYHFKRHAQK